MSAPIRLLVADDHPVVREGLVAMLATEPGFEIVGEAADGETAVTRTRETAPDVLLLDLEMPGQDGIAVLHAVRDLDPPPAVLVFTAYDTDERIVGALQAGARGYLLKGAPRADLFQAVRVVKDGGSLLQPIIASKLLTHVRSPQAPDLPEPLTEREMDVLRLLGQGMANKEIAAALVITERTVKFHISSIMGKLGAGNRTEAVSIAVQQGLLEL